MDSKQIDSAMKNMSPVVFDGTRYERILEYISWYDKNKKRHLSAVLVNRNYTVRVPADKVELAE